MTEKLLEELAADSAQRLRWVVCRRLGVPPWAGAFMSDRRVLRYACQLVLDAREPGSGEARESGGSPSFDMERFEALKGAGL